MYEFNTNARSKNESSVSRKLCGIVVAVVVVVVDIVAFVVAVAFARACQTCSIVERLGCVAASGWGKPVHIVTRVGCSGHAANG